MSSPVRSSVWSLAIVFLIGIFIRFIYFPSDISFTYDQARDAFASLQVAAGNIKILGPSTVVPGIYHGPLFYYLAAPFYKLSHGNPEVVSAILRIYNALGIFLVYLITRRIFTHKAALISALLFAVSFEQSQFSLFLGHPALAVPAILLFYFGLSQLIFSRQGRGLILTFLGLGLAIQFHFAMVGLLPILLLLLLIFRPRLSVSVIVSSLLVFSLTVSTFLLAELKFGFRTSKALFSILTSSSSGSRPDLSHLVLIGSRYIRDNFTYLSPLNTLVFFSSLLVLGYFIWHRSLRRTGIFLSVWLAGGLLPYLFDRSTIPIYYYTMAGSVSLLILMGFLISRLYSISRPIALTLLVLLIVSNFRLINAYNPLGTIEEIIVQSGSLLSQQKQIIDFTYSRAQHQPFAVNALTNPYGINTTWSYLYEWYGLSKYGYLPVWAGDTAAGYPGNLKVISARSQLPPLQFTILEPSRGMYPWLKYKFSDEENLFTHVIDEYHLGEFTIQSRIPRQ
jgi:4-amino-4-deoxy-L-arabinose transferase-like glycosyltransferase